MSFAAAGKPPPSGAPAVLPVDGLSQQEIAEHWRRGYRYGVLGKPKT